MFAFSPDQWQAVRLSVFVAAVATAACLPPGIAVAWLLARRDFWGKTLLETLINLPLVLPPVVTGYLLLVTFGRQGWIGRWLDRLLGLQIVFTWKGAALASAVMAFPFLVHRSGWPSLKSTCVWSRQPARWCRPARCLFHGQPAASPRRGDRRLRWGLPAAWASLAPRS